MNTSGKNNVWLLLIIAILLLAWVLFFLNTQPDENENQTTTEHVLLLPEPVVEALDRVVETDSIIEQKIRPEGEILEIEVPVILPELQYSDTTFKQDLLAVSDKLKLILYKKGLIRKYIFTLNDLSQGSRPPLKLLRELPFKGQFSVINAGDKLYMSPTSYHRYDNLAQAINSIDNQAAIGLYKKYLPLFNRVFKAFSYPKAYQLSDIIKAAVGKVLQAPVITQRIELIHPTVRYKFANPKLEKLSALDKQMLRMGPENTRLIQAKLRELISLLLEVEQE